VPAPGCHSVIGDRPTLRRERVAALGKAVRRGLMAGGVLPVMKHLPGHAAPLPTATSPASGHGGAGGAGGLGFLPFRKLAALPAAMTRHVVFTAYDSAAPAVFRGP